MTKRTKWWPIAFAALAGSSGCGAPTPGGCTRSSECGAGEICVDRRCVGGASDAGLDAPTLDGALPDVPPISCGGRTCRPGETCGDGGTCACPGDPCDTECCAGADVCYLGACTTPGGTCARSIDCGGGAYCETAIGRCLPSAGRTPCEYRPPAGVFSPELAWSWPRTDTPSADVYQIISTPIVVPLEPMSPDPTPVVPAIVFLAGTDITGAELRAVRGDDGRDLFHVAGRRFVGQSHLAAGDLDGDGTIEIVGLLEGDASYCGFVGLHENAHLAAFGPDGAERWVSATAVSAGAAAPAIADLDGDGRAEIIVGGSVFEYDGVLRWTAPPGIDGCLQAGAYSIAADIAGGPAAEVLVGATAYDAAGAVVWRAMDGAAPVRDGMPGIADFDGDGAPEVVLVHGGSGGISVLDAATGVRRCAGAAPAASIGGGPPAIGDFDGDDRPEIGVVFQGLYVAFEGDCSVLWSRTVTDASGQTSSCVFDFDGDGESEVVYTDEAEVHVFRGRDGTDRFTLPHRSATGLENPVVADVDGDGHTEIVAVGQQLPSIEVFRDVDRNWVASRSIWNEHAYHVTNVLDSGGIPAFEADSWAAAGVNSYRTNVEAEGVFDAPDLELVDLRIVPGSCFDASARVVNRGARGVRPPVRVAFVLSRAGTDVDRAEVATTRTLLPGESERVEVSLAGLSGIVDGYTLVATVDPDDASTGFGVVRECDEADGTAGPIDVACIGPE